MISAGCASSTPPTTQSNGPKNGKQYVIGWSFHNDAKNEFWKLFIESFTSTAQAGGAKVVFCSGQGDAAKQADCVDQFIAQNVDAMAIAPVDSSAIVGPIKKANAAKIPVVIWLAGVPSSSGAHVVAWNETADRDAGASAGKAILDGLKRKYGAPKGLVLEVQGLMTQSLAQVRSAGLHSVLDPYPNIKVVAKPADWDTGKATAIIQDWVSANPGTDAVWLASDANYTPAAKAALTAAHRWAPIGDPRHVILVGMDGSNIAVNAAKCGFADYVADFSFPIVSPILAEQLLKYLKTGSIPKVGEKIPVSDQNVKFVEVRQDPAFLGVDLYIPVFDVTKDNADNPLLFANKYQGAPNGTSPCSGT
jgi:ABC-type sugar transport system substrate-binding protein